MTNQFAIHNSQSAIERSAIGTTRLDGLLVLSDGTAVRGTGAGAAGVVTGELVFQTGMVGYVEALTDPSYAGQILVFTYPLIGNYGVSEADTWESQKIHARGAIFSELSPFYSNQSAQK